MKSVFDGFNPDDLFELIGERTPRSAVFTTFTFSPAAFREKYLIPLQKIGCSQIIVVADKLGYAQSMDDASFVEGIGTDYLLRVASCSGAFHSKLFLVDCGRSRVLGVGSGNLTVSGIQGNAEVGTLVDVNDPDTIGQLDKLSIQIQSKAGFLAGSDFIDGIAIDNDTSFLTNLSIPIVDQLPKIKKVERIEVVSPFLDDGRALHWLETTWPGVPIRVRVDPKFGAVSTQFIEELGQKEHVTLSVPRDENSPAVHGKLVAWVGEPNSTVMIGSANLSSPALLETKNFEAVVLRRLTTTDAKKLLKVPQVKWRKAKQTDAFSGNYTQSRTRFKTVVAELKSNTLSMAWKSDGSIEVSVSIKSNGRIIFQSEIGVNEKSGVKIDCSIQVDKQMLVEIDAPCLLELSSLKGNCFRGWIEIQELLISPPEHRRRLRFLKQLVSDPEGIDADGVVGFIEWLRRHLDAETSSVKTRKVSSLSKVVEEDDEIIEDRNSLLRSGDWGAESESGILATVERSLDVAATQVRFFESEDNIAPKKNTPKASPSKTSGERRSHSSKPIAPPKINSIVRALLHQMNSSLSTVSGLRATVSKLHQLSVCVRAVEFCRGRWHIDQTLAKAFIEGTVLRCLAPGKNSVLNQTGALLRLDEAELNEIKDGRGIERPANLLLAMLVVSIHLGSFKRQGVAKDLLLVLRRAFPADKFESDEATLQELWKIVGDDVQLPNMQETLSQIENQQGQVSQAQNQRRRLLQIVGKLSAAGNEVVDLDDELLEVGIYGDQKARLKIILSGIKNSSSKIEAFELETGDDACPKCHYVIPAGRLGRFSNPLHFEIHRCGALLMRAINE